jgi:WD40 repeat protein
LHSAWSSDDTRFAVAFKQGVQIWDTEKAALLRKVAPVGERLAWSPTGNTLAIGTPQSIQLVDAESGEVKGVLNRPGSGYSGSLKGLEWSPNGERMACFDGWNVCLFDVQSAELLGHCKHEGGEGFGSCLAWFDDGRRFATGTNGSGDIRIWETDPLRLSRVVPRLAGEVAVVSPGGRFACYSSGNTVRIQDLQNDKQTCALLELEGDAYVAASANGHFRGSPGIEKQLVYVVRTDRGQETVTPAEFAQRYGWKNEPDRVSVTDGNQPAGS